MDTDPLSIAFATASRYADWSTIAVACGVFIELGALLVFSKSMPAPEKAVLVFATALITAGCVGEYIFGSMANHAAAELQQASDRTVAALKTQQEADHKIAAQAAAHAADLGVTVDNLRNFVTQKERDADRQLAEFKKFTEDERVQTAALIAQLNDDKANLDKARDDARAAAKQAEAELAAMVAANKPRDMLPQQQSDFVTQLKPFGTLVVNVLTPVQNSADAGPLGSLLVALLKQANWKVGIGAPGAGWVKTVLVCVGEHPNDNVAKAAQTIVLALRAAGIQSFIDMKDGPNIPLSGFGAPLPNPDMTILVGSKQ